LSSGGPYRSPRGGSLLEGIFGDLTTLVADWPKRRQPQNIIVATQQS